MPFQPPSASHKNLRVKDSVAATLREEIIRGSLKPGETIVEGKRAARLGVAQASIREAINILAAEGFVEKVPGRSARVVILTDDDIAQMYQVRNALESLAARLMVERKVPLGDLDQALADMGAALECGNARLFYERDVRFHLLIAAASGNRYLEQELRRFLVPLFAFVVIRVQGITGENVAYWADTMDRHRKLMAALQSGDPLEAEAQFRHSLESFHESTRLLLTTSNWKA